MYVFHVRNEHIYLKNGIRSVYETAISRGRDLCSGREKERERERSRWTRYTTEAHARL